MRELVIGSLIGMLGALALVLGIQGLLSPKSALIGWFGKASVASAAVGVGLLFCIIEIRIILPAIKRLKDAPRPGD